MRISLLTPEYPPSKPLGGIATHTFTRGRALARAGHEVQVVTLGDAGTAVEDGVTVVRRQPGPCIRSMLDRLCGKKRFADATLGWKPDVVHAAEFDTNAWWIHLRSRGDAARDADGMVTDIDGQSWAPRTHVLNYLERDQTRRNAAVYASSRERA